MNRELLMGVFLLSLSPLLSGCEGGRSGAAYVREADGSIGATIPGVFIEFIKEDRSDVRSVTTGADGRYSIDLSSGRWVVTATHRDYEDYSSSPGFAVVGGLTRQTLNVFLRSPTVTTVFIVRHAEKADPYANDPGVELSEAGKARARDLADAVYRAGITAVYSTDFVRTRTTVGPLADTFDLEIQLYQSPTALASTIASNNEGDVILVAGHSGTVGEIAAALGGAVSTQSIGNYDNLYAVTKRTGMTNVVNLRYGESSTPDMAKNAGEMTTLLLVQDAGGAVNMAQRLLHAIGEAGVAAVYAASGQAIVQPLANALGLGVSPFDATDLAGEVGQVLADHPSETVVVVGTNDVLSAILQEVEGHPTPPIFAGEIDNLFLVTLQGTGGGKVLNVRY